MKKGFLICGIASIFLALTSPALAQETIPPEENAATYYNKAFELMKDLPSGDAKTRAFKIIEEGWKEEDKGLEKLLKVNEPAFEEFRKGVTKEKCQFIEEEITFDTLVPHLAKGRNFSRLVILEARLCERNGDLEKAIGNCLDAIKLGHDLGKDRILLSKLVDVAIFYIAEDALLSLVRNDKLTPQLAKNTLKSLLQLDGKAVSAKEALLGEMATATPGLTKFLGETLSDIDRHKELLERILKEYDRLAKEYFGTIISYMVQGKYSEIIPFAESFCDEIRNEMRVFQQAQTIVQAILFGSDIRPKAIANILALMLLPAIARFPNDVARADARSRAIATVLAVRLFKMEKGRYPQSLDELVPEYLENVPLDPFDLKPLRYRKRQGKWIVYSIGPDGKDDGGVENYTHIQPEEGTDLIFEVE